MGEIQQCLLASLRVLTVMLSLFVSSAYASPSLSEFLTEVQTADIFPGATHITQTPSTPPVAQAWADKQLLGYVYLNSDYVNSAGYSSKPIHILIGLALDGEITGAKLVKHDEPIVLIGIPISRVNHFIDGYIGLNFVKNPPRGRMSPPVDIISGATVTLMVIGDSITRSSLLVARATSKDASNTATATAPKAKVSIDTSQNQVQDWDQLLSNGSVSRMLLTVDDVNQAFTASNNTAAAEHPETGEPDDTFIDLYTAQVSIPSIGRSLLGEATWNHLQSRLSPGQQAVLVAGNGSYSFKGSGYVRGGVFDRIEVLQDQRSFRFRDRNHQRLGDIAAQGAPSFREIALFVVPEDEELTLGEPWQLQLLVQRIISVKEKAFMTFDLSYNLPDQYLIKEAIPVSPAASSSSSDSPSGSGLSATNEFDATEDSTPLWQHLWAAKTVQITVLAIALLILTSVFFFQNWFARHAVFYDRFRLVYLTFTLFWLGGYCMAQLSVVNVLTFTHSLRTGFQWEYFLMDPIVFILWCVTAVSSLFWNRGAFCGWLCPFGSLQELMSRVARKLGVKQIKVPFGLHERLVALKYVIFLGLFGLSLYELGFAEQMSEVEPFKTVIILKFMRYWPFVLFAALVLFAGLFIERFYCRYLCPLGAALAIPARLRLFDWLKRYQECGNPCQRCAVECPVDAIHPEGHINPNECIQCLNCQVLYHHDKKCPHLIKKNAKRAYKPAPTTAASTMQEEPIRRVIRAPRPEDTA